MKHREKPSVGFIILSWNGAKLLGTCLDSLKNQTFSNFVVCVVDNASTDNTADVYKSFEPKMKMLLIKNKTNLGFAKAVNQGVEAIFKLYPDIEYVSLLNNDVVLNKNWLDNMMEAMNEDKKIGLAQGINYTDKSSDNIDSSGIYIEEGFIPRQKTSTKKTPFSIGPNAAAILLRREFIEDISYKNELLDKTFFAYVEDVDLILRAFLRGWKHSLVQTATAVHAGSATGNLVSVKKMYWGSRNLVWLVVKNVPLLVILKKLGKITVSRLADIEYLAKTNKPLCWAYIKGLVVGLVLSPKYLLKRRYTLKRRKVDNISLIKALTASNPPLTNPFRYLAKRLQQ